MDFRFTNWYTTLTNLNLFKQSFPLQHSLLFKIVDFGLPTHPGHLRLGWTFPALLSQSLQGASPPGTSTRIALIWTHQGKRKQGRPKAIWRNKVEKEINSMGLTLMRCKLPL